MLNCQVYLCCLLTKLYMTGIHPRALDNWKLWQKLYMRYKRNDLFLKCMILLNWNIKKIHVCVFRNCFFYVWLMTITLYILAHLAKGTVRFCHHLTSVHRPCKLSHLNLLLFNHWTKLNQMAAVTKNRSLSNCPLLLYYKSKWATASTWQWVV